MMIQGEIRKLQSHLQTADKEFECPSCGVVYVTAFGRATCGDDKCIDLYAAKHNIKLGWNPATRRENLEVKWRAVGIPVDFMHAEISHVPKEHRWQTRQSVRIMGAVGRGKTHVAVALLKWAIAEGANDCRFISAANYLKAIRATYRKGAKQSEADVLADFTAPDVLVLDDLGAAKNSEHGWAEILSLLEERGWAKKTTVVTTNLTMVEIFDQEPRVGSRMQGWRLIELTGEDRRALP